MSRKRYRIRKSAVAVALVLLLITVGFGVYFARNAIEKATYPMRYREYVERYAEQYGLEPALVFAVIKTESSFRADAISSAGAIGLMQIMPSTAQKLAKRLGEETPSEEALREPETNIRYGCAMLAWMRGEFGSMDTVLAAYNAGWGNVSKWLADEAYSSDGVTLNVIPFKETENFVSRVNLAADKYRELYYGG